MKSLVDIPTFLCITLMLVLVPPTLQHQQQQSLRYHGEQNSFIASSIFGKKLQANTHAPRSPVSPSYYARDYDQPSQQQTTSLSQAEYAEINTFLHLPFQNCFARFANSTFDIALVGAPFDLGVSYRPGARFGPSGARLGTRRISPEAGWDTDHGSVNPLRDWATVVDCGDIDNTPFDKLEALHELEAGWKAINAQTARNSSVSDNVRILSVGGDHTITLPILRALHGKWGRKVKVLHFDSHLDTWDPKQLGGGLTKYSEVNHGTMLHLAHEEGLISPSGNLHVGTRCALYSSHFDIDNDLRCGFGMIRAREFDRVGVEKIIDRIKGTIGDDLVYVSIDVDVLDPAFAPATGTVEPGGLSMRELMRVLRGLAAEGVKIVGADVVEFSPVYDSAAETTGVAVGQIIWELLQWMVTVPV